MALFARLFVFAAAAALGTAAQAAENAVFTHSQAPGAAAAAAPPAYVFLGKDAAAVIADALTKAGAGENIQVHITGAHDEDQLAAGQAPITATPDGLDMDKQHNSWQATLLLKDGERNLPPVKLYGHYDEMSTIPVLKRPLRAGEVIGEEDVEWDQQPITRLRKNTITDAKELIGKSPRRMISQGRPIREDEIANPALINKGAHITLLFQSQNLEISTLGEALDSGARGDVIRVRNLASKTIVMGTVESGDRVRVSAPNSTSAEAM